MPTSPVSPRAMRSPSKLAFATGVAAALCVVCGCASVPPNKPGVGDSHAHIPGIEAKDATTLTADQAAQRLREGNDRFARGSAAAPALAASRSLERVRTTGTEGQRPFAAVLTCADSRTPPEILFDQGVGDLFVVRVAGNVTGTMGLASLEYGADHLGIPLIVVLGHTQCGAVDAAVKSAGSGYKVEVGDALPDAGNLAQLVQAIRPAVAAAQRSGDEPLLLAAIRANVRQSMANLSTRSPILAREIAAGDVHVVGAVYDVTAGTIEWLTPEK